jgi:hypothetical protein
MQVAEQRLRAARLRFEAIGVIDAQGELKSRVAEYGLGG